MTITYLGEDPGGRQATNDKGTRRYTRVFLFKTDDKTDDAYAIGSHASAPLIGQAFHDAWCKSITVENHAPYAGWKITAEYTSERELTEDPTSDPAVITWGSEQFQRPAVFDKNGDCICNSAGDPFDPPNMMDDSRRYVSVTKNLAVVPSWILDYQDAVNSDAFDIDGITVAVGLAKVQSVNVGEVQTRNSIPFRTVSLMIHLQKDGWALKPLDAGFRENVFGEMILILNDDDTFPAAPVPLNGLGRKLSNPSFTNNVFLSFDVYEQLPFTALPLS